jgi:DNA-binding MarR family transcriptional regulator
MEDIMKNRSIGFEIKILNNLITRKIIKEYKINDNCSISHVQMKVIHYLIKNKNNSIYQSDIEKMLEVRRSTVSGILDTMEKNNLIKRVDSKIDGRKKQIILTNKILEFSHDLEKQVISFDKLLIKDIEKEDLNTFFKVVDQMKKNIEN